jgi:membrane fusion protein, multidrug efflux system
MEVTREPTETPTLTRAKLPAIDPSPTIRLPEAPAKKSFKDSATDMLRKRWKYFAVPIAVVVIGLIGSGIYSFFTTESTDDAFVADHVHAISARVAGTVIEVHVNDNQLVKKGDVLVRLDPTDFDVQIKIAEANAEKARNIAARWHGNEVHPFEIIQRNTDVAAKLDADANLEKARLQLKYATIYAPTDGKIGNRSVETGQQVVQVQPLMSLVEQTPWVVANFKESQVARIHLGQKVKLTVDAIGGRTFTGTVDSLAPGSGATFALLPPDNATGNFTKIVQRIPVKIIFDAASIKGFEDRIAPGMSTVVTIDTN